MSLSHSCPHAPAPIQSGHEGECSTSLYKLQSTSGLLLWQVLLPSLSVKARSAATQVSTNPAAAPAPAPTNSCSDSMADPSPVLAGRQPRIWTGVHKEKTERRPYHLTGGAPLVSRAVAGCAAPCGDLEMCDGLHALLRLVLALQSPQQHVQPLMLLIFYHRLVPMRYVNSTLCKLA